jgi:multidomain signaling protein FimX
VSQTDRYRLLIIAGTENRVEAVNSALRNAGVMAQCEWAASLKAAEDVLIAGTVDLIVAFTRTPREELAKVVKLRDKRCPGIPVLGADNKADEDLIADALLSGARDMISLSQPDRINLVVMREVLASKDRRELQELRAENTAMSERLETLIETTDEAIAMVSEGIIVDANPAFADLFGFEDGDAMVGEPMMDIFASGSHMLLKGAVKACSMDRWSDDLLQVIGLRLSEEGEDEEPQNFDAEIQIRKATFEDEPCLQVSVVPSDAEPQIDAALARTDAVSDFETRTAFLDTLRASITSGERMTLAYIRPDKFSRIEQNLGPLGTDVVIGAMSERIRSHMLGEDVGGRFGGTIITVLLRGRDIKSSVAWAEALHEDLSSQVYEAGGASTSLSLTIGLAELDRGKDDLEYLLAKVQAASADARTSKAHPVTAYVPPETDEQGRLTDDAWVKRIKNAIKGDRFRLVFQSIASMQGAEGERQDVLLRMLDDDDQDILPGDFLPAAARNGLMVAVDRWVIAQAVRAAKKQGEGAFYFVRLSDDSLKDHTLPSWIQTVLEKLGVAASALVVQIAERSTENHLKETADLIGALRKIGCGTALEHFGVGSNSEQTLTMVKPDYVKVDGTLMSRITSDEKAQTLVKDLIDSAKGANMLTVAERVEDANTMAVLWQLGVDFIQGHYVQEPELVMEEDA